jgi:hypothetical protein
MTRKTYDKICLSCKHFRPVDALRGKCRVDRAVIAASAYPLMLHQDSCVSWKDAGQQYYIRVGWVKNLTEAEED